MRPYRVATQVPNLDLDDVAALVGPDVFARGTDSDKTFTVQVSNGALARLGIRLIKRLRGGTHLMLSDGLTMDYNKATHILNVTGRCYEEVDPTISLESLDDLDMSP